ncbi:MAG: 5,6-dimethylbenzimidazole synthase [Pseudomonadota bacterium]
MDDNSVTGLKSGSAPAARCSNADHAQSASPDSRDPNQFDPSDQHGLYRAIFSRRDVRQGFSSRPVPPDVLARVLLAAHHAPSVGLMQPWNFILIKDNERRARIHALFERANAEAAELHAGDRGAHYRSLKLEGIRESALNIAVTCNHRRLAPHVLGRSHIAETDLYSTVCAVQNLWLSARVEGLGVGWVSIIDPERLAAALEVPDTVTTVAYLCVGYVDTFMCEPELQRAGWEKRLAVEETIRFETFDGRPATDGADCSKRADLMAALAHARQTFPGSHLVQSEPARATETSGATATGEPPHAS